MSASAAALLMSAVAAAASLVSLAYALYFRRSERTATVSSRGAAYHFLLEVSSAKQWAVFLHDDDTFDRLHAALRATTEDVADVVGTPAGKVRANMFARDPDHKLRIPPGLTYNMDRREELDIAIELGQGSTGRAYALGITNVAIRVPGETLQQEWGPDLIGDPAEQRKVHPDLSWIISVPLTLPGIPPLLIFNVDGIEEADTDRIERATYIVQTWSQMMLYLILDRAAAGRFTHAAH